MPKKLHIHISISVNKQWNQYFQEVDMRVMTIIQKYIQYRHQRVIVHSKIVLNNCSKGCARLTIDLC